MKKTLVLDKSHSCFGRNDNRGFISNRMPGCIGFTCPPDRLDGTFNDEFFQIQLHIAQAGFVGQVSFGKLP